MSYTENIWLFFVLLLGIIIVPGMDMLYVLTNALTGGRRAGLCATFGIMLGGVVHTLFGMIGVGVLLKLAPMLFTLLLFAGAAYMAWIGITLVRSSLSVASLGAAKTRSPWMAFRQGTVTCILNPKAYLFVFSVYPQFMRPQYGSLWPQALVMGTMTTLTQFAIYGGLALAADRSRDFLTSRPGATAFAGRAAGYLFLVIALLTAWHGWQLSAAMKLAEVPGSMKADQQCAHREHTNMARRTHVEVANAQHQNVADHRVEKSPENVDGGGRETAPEGLAKGLWNARPIVPLTKCGTALAGNTPPNK